MTLTTGFIWGGVALLILEKPGGGAPPEFLDLAAGNSRLALAVECAHSARRRGRADLDSGAPQPLGLLIYAVGSDRVAAFRSGVNVDSTRILAYVVGGLFSALGGLGLTMTTGIGSPLAGIYYTLSGVAAVVIGGVQPGRRARRHCRAGHRRFRADADPDRSRSSSTSTRISAR